MPDSELNGDFSKVLQQLMEKPEISNLIASLKSGAQSAPGDAIPAAVTEETADHPDNKNGGSAEGLQQSMPALSPDMLAKLPAVMSMLSGMGAAGQNTDKKSDGGESAQEAEKPAVGDAQRKALLRALRPYLNDKRRNVIDSMLQLEDLTKLFGAGFGR